MYRQFIDTRRKWRKLILNKISVTLVQFGFQNNPFFRKENFDKKTPKILTRSVQCKNFILNGLVLMYVIMTNISLYISNVFHKYFINV